MPTSTQTPKPTAVPESSGTEEKKSPAHAKSAVTGFEFEYAKSDRLPMIRIKLSERIEFKFSKVDDRLFKITIPEGGVASPALKLPQFPPHDFIGFTYFKAATTSTGLEISIGVERGIRINAFAQDSDILVKALNR
jgi:hypothetical protein